MARPVVFLTISTGWAIRNLFQTRIVERLSADADVVAIAPPSIAAGLRRLGHDKHATVVPVEPGPEPVLWKALRQIRKKLYMESRNSGTERIWETYTHRPLYQRLGGKVLRPIAKGPRGQRLGTVAERIDLAINKDKRFQTLFRDYRPSLLFACHASTYFEECLARHAFSLGVPAALMILSWDHLSSKVVLNSGFRRLLVWNAQSKAEILSTYPNYCADSVRIVGIPHYDIYAEPPLVSYAGWCAKHGLDSRKRTLLFSSMPQVRHSEQHIILEQLLLAITRQQGLPPDLQVLLKCHPFDDSRAYDALLNHYPLAIIRTGLEPGQRQEDWVPTADELVTARDALYYCSANINIFSTVSLEAAYFDKPIVHIAFDPTPPQNRIPCRAYYEFEHFKPIVAYDATTLVYSQDELHSAIAEALNSPDAKAEQRSRLVRGYFGSPVGSACDRLLGEVRSCLAG